ncbi:LysR family transcriptional regulator [Roseateles amylovorans]|uniref:LysR substrate-binding domain-containing protein n=1 Tax=Roseateles amylovorans TaxID=2978473 RepID=A0ABY6B062_9BURK|nr:LysR substrate-binding domain-containing protein [Roseateles amylovorans]UXH78791.1 LysR substrate-binding domain-containing protein [Roseateles amylovorans]
MSLRHARVLLALHDTGNASLAAELLHVTQPAVSKTLAELEQGLGQTLFLRRGRNMHITPIGRRLLSLARKIEADLHRAAGDVATMVRGASGELRIGATNAALARLLPTAITSMKAEFPQLTLSVRTHALRSLFDDLLAGRLDMVIARVMPQDEPLGLQRHPLIDQPERLTMSAHHPLARTPHLSWETLSRQRWIWHLPGTRTRMLMDRLWQRMQLPLPTDLIESGDLMLALKLMRQIPLIAVVPHDVAMNAARDGTVVILPHDVNLGLGPLSAWHLPDTPSEAVERFQQLLEDAARQARGADVAAPPSIED